MTTPTSNAEATGAETANTTSGDQNGVQAGVINGNVEFNGLGAAKQHLVTRYASQEELREVSEQFVSPRGFTEAARILDEDSVVVLCGRGAGRSHAAHRLLVDSGALSVAHLNPGRSLGSITAEELATGRGYIWAATELNGRAIPSADFAHCHKLIRSSRALLVVITDNRNQTGIDHTVQLTAPVALDVADSMIQFARPDAVEGPAVTLKSHLAIALEDRDPPEKAVRAARLAIRVADGQLDVADAVRDLRDRVGDAVARWFDGWEIREYALAFAVALLEHEPFDEVVRQAQNLDLNLRQAQLPSDKAPRPPKIFAKPKKELLADIQADVVVREHPQYEGLEEETVRFDRQDWAAAIVRHVWREYPGAHPVLLEWMKGMELLSRFPQQVRRALCMITAEVPAHDPLRLIVDLAQSTRFTCRDVAASSMAHLADDHNLRPLVDKTLATWMDSEVGLRLGCAALVQSTAFGKRDLTVALDRLGDIAKSSRHAAQAGVMVSVLRLLGDAACRAETMERVVAWSSQAGRGGLRPVTMVITTVLGGFVPVVWFDQDQLADQHRDHVRLLVSRLLRDGVYGDEAIDIMSELAHKAKWRKSAHADLKKIVALITSDLSWRNRVLVARKLIRLHPQKRRAIRHVLRTAARTEPRVHHK